MSCVKISDYLRADTRVLSSECILCQLCVNTCARQRRPSLWRRPGHLSAKSYDFVPHRLRYEDVEVRRQLEAASEVLPYEASARCSSTVPAPRRSRS